MCQGIYITHTVTIFQVGYIHWLIDAADITAMLHCKYCPSDSPRQTFCWQQNTWERQIQVRIYPKTYWARHSNINSVEGKLWSIPAKTELTLLNVVPASVCYCIFLTATANLVYIFSFPIESRQRIQPIWTVCSWWDVKSLSSYHMNANSLFISLKDLWLLFKHNCMVSSDSCFDWTFSNAFVFTVCFVII